jgi:hypothetical protein
VRPAPKIDLHLVDPPPLLVRQCAWCGRYGDKTSNRWIDPLRDGTEIGVEGVTSTMCPDCWDDVLPNGIPYPY